MKYILRDNNVKEKNIGTDVNTVDIMVFQDAKLVGFLWKDKLHGEHVTWH